MQRYLAFIGFLSIGITLFGGGFYLGYKQADIPTQEEEASALQYQTAVNDIAIVGDKYKSLYDLCEQKYQSAISGDYTEAFQYKGQIEATEQSVAEIMSKYESEEQ